MLKPSSVKTRHLRVVLDQVGYPDLQLLTIWELLVLNRLLFVHYRC